MKRKKEEKEPVQQFSLQEQGSWPLTKIKQTIGIFSGFRALAVSKEERVLLFDHWFQIQEVSFLNSQRPLLKSHTIVKSLKCWSILIWVSPNTLRFWENWLIYHQLGIRAWSDLKFHLQNSSLIDYTNANNSIRTADISIGTIGSTDRKWFIMNSYVGGLHVWWLLIYFKGFSL